ncbi:MAG: ABC transporter permease subunit [Cyanobacteria bacterium]|nr:ABC transporter permease subunit [Cyanobacteriota bacterium]MDA0866637.1 ABC transporter permease subunit [Cyanobacteriota bacterium]
MVLGAIALSLAMTGIGRQPVLNLDGLPQLLQFLGASMTPDLQGDFLLTLAKATGVTFAYGVCGTVLSLGLGLVGGVLCSETWWRSVWPRHISRGRWVWRGLRWILALPRAIHVLVWGLLLMQVMGLEPLVAVLAIAIPFGAIVAKVFADIFDETPQAPLQALLATGTPPLNAWLYGLLPQALPNLLSYGFYRFECSLRAAAVLGIIGAGGLGYEILLSLQSLQYHQLWTGFYALMLLNGAVDLWSGLVRRRLGFTSRLDLNASRRTSSPQPHAATANRAPPRRDPMVLGSGVAAGITVPLCFAGLPLHWGLLGDPQTWQRLSTLLRDANPFPLTLAALGPLLPLSVQTLAMATVAIAMAGTLAMILSFPAAQTIVLPGGLLRPGKTGPMRSFSMRSLPWGWVVLVGSRLLLLLCRAIPAPIWALVALYLFFPGVLPGAIALAIHNFGVLGRLMAEVNENLEDRPVRALRTLGSGTTGVLLYGILPQNLGRFLAYICYRWEVCLRETVIVGLVGTGGLGRLMTEQISSFDYPGLTLTLGALVVLTAGVDGVSRHLRGVLTAHP